MNLSVEEFGILAYAGFYLIGLVLPVATFCLLRRWFPTKPNRPHFAVSVAAAWFASSAYMFWTLPVRIAYRNIGRDPAIWDGTGETSGTMLLGWILPSLALLIFLGASAIFRTLRTFRDRPDSQRPRGRPN
jgi:hypothetical protein